MSGASLSLTRDVVGVLRRAVDHGEEDDLGFLLFNQRGVVGWAGVVGLLLGCYDLTGKILSLSLYFLFLFSFLF
jgi:hypothetical protein